MSGDPGGELDRLRNAYFAGVEKRRAELEIAALLSSAELGYANLTVQAVLDRSGVSRNRFYREFDNLAACFSSAYCREIEQLSERLLKGCDGGWLAGLDGALATLQEMVLTEPKLTRAMVVEVHVAGGQALAKRKEVLERLSHALDGARREIPRSRHSPPPLTAPFMLSAIEAAVCHFFLDPEVDDFGQTVAALRNLIVDAYRGDS